MARDPDKVILDKACSGGGCFPKGSVVTLADWTTKTIEDMRVGEQVRGRRGEINPVIGKMSCWLSARGLWRINGAHITTDEHTHIGPGGYYVISREQQGKDFGHSHWVERRPGIFKKEVNVGLNPNRISDLELGTELETLDGTVTVKTLDRVEADFFTEVWSLVVGKSHTYFVDGYCVTGWPREDDWDWDNWVMIR